MSITSLSIALMIMPGVFMKRGKHCRPIIAHPRHLAAKVMVWSLWCDDGRILIAAVGAGSKHDRMAEETETIAAVGAGSKHDRMAEETETVADDRWVAASRGNGTAVLKLPVDGDKPLDVVGRCSE